MPKDLVTEVSLILLLPSSCIYNQVEKPRISICTTVTSFKSVPNGMHSHVCRFNGNNLRWRRVRTGANASGASEIRIDFCFID